MSRKWGRSLTRDTYTGEEDDPLSLHLYTYCGDDAVNRIDPSGHIFETILDIACLTYDLVDTVAPGVPGSYVGKGGVRCRTQGAV